MSFPPGSLPLVIFLCSQNKVQIPFHPPFSVFPFTHNTLQWTRVLVILQMPSAPWACWTFPLPKIPFPLHLPAEILPILPLWKMISLFFELLLKFISLLVCKVCEYKDYVFIFTYLLYFPYAFLDSSCSLTTYWINSDFSEEGLEIIKLGIFLLLILMWVVPSYMTSIPHMLCQSCRKSHLFAPQSINIWDQGSRGEDRFYFGP